MYLVTRNSPLVHWNNKCPDQPAHHILIGTFVSRKCNQKYRQSFKQFGSVMPDLGPHCLQSRNDRDDAPTHPLTEIPWTAHTDQVRGLMSTAFFFYFCLTTHRHISSYEDWTTALSLILRTGDAKASSGVFFKIILCVCVWGGGGGRVQ